ncbi:TIGR03086 family metal-binding protein [Streptomyces sp. 2P-4]|uniref:TIGR03086 family metal-binding protein n=1 Tax=Streptomyces sp. 2P-4 TaxID=2931974 RepID=UPI00253F6E45|nr:TIGR03086 family metal-binding protein [Streptomyces sp. 2P-4]
MPEPLLEQHAEALRLFGSRVRAVAPGQRGLPTPCAEWTVRDLVNHVTAEQLWVPPLVTEGCTVAEVGDRFAGDILGDDPAAAWDRAARAAHTAFASPWALERIVSLSYGPSKAAAYCAELTADCVVHAWDLARAVGADDRLPAGLVRFALDEITPYADGLAAAGMYGPPLVPPPGADDQTRLLALTGRAA